MKQVSMWDVYVNIFNKITIKKCIMHMRIDSFIFDRFALDKSDLDLICLVAT